MSLKLIASECFSFFFNVFLFVLFYFFIIIYLFHKYNFGDNLIFGCLLPINVNLPVLG